MILNCKCNPDIPDWTPVNVTEVNGVWIATAYVAGVNTYSGFTTPSAADDDYVYVSVYGESAVNSTPPHNNLYYNTVSSDISWKSSAALNDVLIARYYDQTALVVMYSLPTASSGDSDLQYLFNNNYVNITVESVTSVTDSYNYYAAVGYDSANSRYVLLDSNSPDNQDLDFIGFGEQQSDWTFAGGIYSADYIVFGLIPTDVDESKVDGVATPGAPVYANKLAGAYYVTTNPAVIASDSKLLVGYLYNKFYESGVPVPGKSILMRANPFYIGV